MQLRKKGCLLKKSLNILIHSSYIVVILQRYYFIFMNLKFITKCFKNPSKSRAELRKKVNS